MILTITNGSYGKNTHAYFLLARIFYSATALFGRSNMKQSKFGILEQILIRSVGVRAYQSSVLLEREKGEKSSLIIEKAPLILTFSPEGRRDKAPAFRENASTNSLSLRKHARINSLSLRKHARINSLSLRKHTQTNPLSLWEKARVRA